MPLPPGTREGSLGVGGRERLSAMRPGGERSGLWREETSGR